MGTLVEPNQVACRRLTTIYLGQPPVLAAREGESDDSGEPWSLGSPAPPLLQKEGKGHDSGVQRRVGTVGWRGEGVQGYRGTHGTYPAPSRQPANLTANRPTLIRCHRHRTCMCEYGIVLYYKIFNIVLPMQHMTCIMHHDGSDGTQCLLSPGSACSLSCRAVYSTALLCAAFALHRHLFFFFFLLSYMDRLPQLPSSPQASLVPALATTSKRPRVLEPTNRRAPAMGRLNLRTRVRTCEPLLASAYLASVTTACTAPHAHSDPGCIDWSSPRVTELAESMTLPASCPSGCVPVRPQQTGAAATQPATQEIDPRDASASPDPPISHLASPTAPSPGVRGTE